MIATARTLADLRRSLAEAGLRTAPVAKGRVSFGVAGLDEVLGGGLVRAALHEVYAPGTADLAAATGFAVGLALRAAGQRPILWVRQDYLDSETGALHPPGLSELGLDPGRVLLVRARDAEGVLRAGAEAARCGALGAALIEPWGDPRLFDLTATRRLSLAAEGSGVATLLLRASASQSPSAARTRWLVGPLPSRALEANAPGDPAFKIRLLRHRGGLSECEWRVEWSRDRQCFAEGSGFPERPVLPEKPVRTWPSPDVAPLSRPLVPLPANGQAAAEKRVPAAGRAKAFSSEAGAGLREDDASGHPLPLVLIETQRGALRITACDRQALDQGLAPGLTLADARARIPGLISVEADPEADQRQIERLAAFCDRFTPLVALDPPHGLMLDVTGCAHLFGGEAALLALIGKRLEAGGLAYRASIAGTPEAAHALAHFTKGGIVPPGRDEAATRNLPLAALRLPAETALALSRAGLKTLADLAERPSAALSARFGEGLAARLRRTLGREDIRITPLRPPPDCVVERHFAEPILAMDSLDAVVVRLVEEAARVLEQRGEGGRAFEIQLLPQRWRRAPHPGRDRPALARCHSRAAALPRAAGDAGRSARSRLRFRRGAPGCPASASR